ncbi:hypothetical protein [Dolichospermum compactum]|uniref:Uncharacterized protein n=1 Tax=Dolichospermum compactum NIES-806 TaxID=1973481 RepID=A0A1Z4V7R2_9CYAN|nr:hypothetical protein [Dolichospermum compactum]BAZ87484.1 hypothetical protein NIES806_37070 [Dolichospermum compactum NIES-806]
MNKYCRDQARDELWLMMGAGATAGVAGGISPIVALTFQTTLAGVQGVVITRIAQIYDMSLIPASGAGAMAAAIIGVGGGQFLFNIGSIVAGLIPGIGSVVQPAMGAAAVKALGEVAITYFENMYPNKIYSPKTKTL